MSDLDKDQGTRPSLRPQVFAVEKSREPEPTTLSEPRVIATAQTGRIAPSPPVSRVLANTPARRRPSLFKKLAWTGLLVAFIGWLFIDFYLWLISAFEHGPVIGGAAATAVTVGVAAVVAIIAREVRSYLSLKSVEENQKMLTVPSAPELRAADVQQAIRHVIAAIPRSSESIAGVEAFQRQVQRHHSPDQQIELLSQTVMIPLDRRAEAIVRRASARAFGITAISPTAVTDALFFIATSIRMVREIAACYGHRPTAFATLHLLRRLVTEAGRLGVVDLVGATLTQHIGGAVAERIAASAAESVYATQRMARLGLVTMEICRPVLFQRKELPGIMSSLIGNVFPRHADNR